MSRCLRCRPMNSAVSGLGGVPHLESMLLSDRVLTMITGVAGLHLGEFPGEQRVTPRVRVGRRGNIARLADGKPTSVALMVRDVSATGVGLVHTEPVPL